MLTDYKIIQRKRVVNGEFTLSFFVFQTERNKHSFPLVEEESVVEYDGQEFRIKKVREYTKGHTPVKEVTAPHVFFDIIDDYQYETISGSINIVQALNHVFSVTDWTWVNHGAFNSVEFENFGDGTALELFKTILDRYGAEYEITGPREVTLKNQIGAFRDAQFRYKHNIKTLYKDIDSSNVSTYIKGFGKDITVEYTSPNASVYGIRHAPPVKDERFTNVTSLKEHLKKILNDTPNIVIDIEVIELKKQGIPVHEYDLGDTIFLIHEGLGIDATVRILEYTDYPESYKSPSIVLANYKPSMTKVLTSFQQTSKTLKQLTDDDGNLTLKLKRLYRNSDHYSDHTGDWYISPEDPNAYVHIGAGGIDVHRGLIRVERDDGYPVIIGGALQNEFGIMPHNPPFRNSEISINGWWWSNSDTTHKICEAYMFKHDSRYLKMIVGMLSPSGNNIGFEVVNWGPGTVLAQKITNHSDPNSGIAYYGEILTIDLGVPTGELIGLYVKLWSGINGSEALARIIGIYKEG